MIDIENKILKFGYGDICVNFDSLRYCIFFIEFEPVKYPGYKFEKDESVNFKPETEIEINILSKDDNFSFAKYSQFECFLKMVMSGDISCFDFDGYMFDFSNYNEKSVLACLNNLHYSVAQYLSCCAV